MAEGIITHGIGSAPGGLAWFLLFGLAPTVWVTEACRVYTVAAEARVLTVSTETRTLDVAAEARVLTVECNGD